MLIKRIGFYLTGLSLGIVFVTFIFSKKKTSCSYGPEARVIKDINSKKIAYSMASLESIIAQNIDTIVFKEALLYGDVNFKKSEPRKEPCGLYHIDLEFPEKKATIIIGNCNTESKVESVTFF